MPGSEKIWKNGKLLKVNQEYTINIEQMYTKAKDSAKLFDKTKVKGKPVYTVVRGRIVMEAGKVDLDSRGYGQYLPAER